MTLINMEGVSRIFRHTPALNNVSLSIEKGELFGVLGPDGAGKTTLLRMLAAVLNTSAGKITVSGFDSFKEAEEIKSIMGYMPQQFGLYSDLTVQENLDFVADVFNVYGQQRQQRMERLYEFTRLADFKNRRAGRLSGGMKKKLGLACALIHEPELLLLDEPTTGVDPVARRDFWDLLSGLHAGGTTTIVSTPYMDEAERCNRVALLYQGTLMACNSPHNIRAGIPGKVIAVQNSNIRLLRETLKDLPFLMDIQTYGDQLNLIVSGDVEQARQVIRGKMESQNIEIKRLEEVPVRMEEAFIYLVNKARQDSDSGL